MAKVKSMAKPWRIMTDNTKRLKESFAKMNQALAEDEKKERERGSGLPSDWRNRILRMPVSA